MRKILLTVILSAVMIFLLSGCIGKEPNEIAYVVAFGIDRSENGNYKITFQYANPTKISGGESGKGGESGENVTETVVIESPTLYGAIGIANHIDSKTFSLSHTKLVIFSREIAEGGLKDIAEMFIRSEELRPDVFLAVAENSANEYLNDVKPVMEINPAKYYQLIFNKNELMGMPESIEKNFFSGVETGNYDSLLPLAGVSKNEKNEINNEPFEYKMYDYVAGENAAVKKSENETIGSAVFKGDKMVGVIGSIDTEIYTLLDDEYIYSYITLKNEKTPDDPITVKLIQKKRPDYDIDINNKRIKIKLFLDGEIYSIPSGYSIEEDIQNFEKNSADFISKACTEFIKNVYNKYNSDIVRFNERVKKYFLTNEEYDKFKKSVNYADYDVEVQTDLKIRRTGLIVRE